MTANQTHQRDVAYRAAPVLNRYAWNQISNGRKMAGEIITAITSIFDLLKYGAESKGKRLEEEKKALLTLHKAVNETKIFFHEIDDYEMQGVKDEKNR